MKKILVTLSFIGLICNYWAQTTTSFRKNYDVSLFDIPMTSIEGLTPNTYVFSGFHAFSSSITAVDNVGVTTWSKRFSNGISMYIGDVKKDVSLNRYYVCGGDDSGPAFLMFLDASGNLISGRNFSIAEADGASFNRVIKTSDGGYLCVGTVTGYDPDGGGAEVKFNSVTNNDAGCDDPHTEFIQSPLIVKFDASGNHLWHQVLRYYTTSATPANRIYNDASFVDVIEISDGYIAVGNYDVNNVFSDFDPDDCDDTTPTDAMIIKTNKTDGSIIYHRQIDNPSNSTSQTSKSFNSASLTAAGLPLISGSDGNGRPMMLMRFAGSGGFANPTWISKYRATSFFGAANPFEPGRFFETSDGNYAVWGFHLNLSFTGFTVSIALMKINSAGAVQWSREYTNGLASILPHGQQSSDDGFMSLSYTLAGGGHNLHFIKTDPEGRTSTDCPEADLAVTTETPSYTWGTPIYNAWNSNTVTNGVYSPTVTNITPTESIQCLTEVTACTPPAAPTTVTATPATICPGESSSITASGPSDPNVIYNVYDAATGGTNLGATPVSVSPTTSTSYWVEAVDNSDPLCISTTRTEVIVTVNNGPTISAAGDDQTVCGNSATLAGNTATSGTGTWTVISGSGTFADDNNPTTTVSGLSNGPNVFRWTISSPPCPDSFDEVTITSVTAPTVAAAGDDQSICSTSTTLEGNTPAIGTGTWTVISGSGTFADENNPTTTVSGLGLGDNIFEWTITNAPCSPSSDQVTITNTGGPTISIVSSNDVSCNGGNDGEAEVTASGGVGPYIYSWSPSGGSNATATGLTPGDYTATVTDDIGCSDNILVTIGEPTAISLDVSSTPSSCATPDGTATVVANGGSGSYTYSWSPSGGNADVAVGLASGDYTVTVTDANLCEASESVTVGVSNGPVITIESTVDATCNGGVNGSAEISVTGGTGNYTYSWSPSGGSAATATDLSSGDYTVTVEDEAGCVATETISIGEPDALSVTADIFNATCAGDDGSISLTVTGGTANYSYEWQPNGETTSTITGDAGSYNVTVTDANNCEITETYSIGLTDNLQASVDPEITTIEGGESVDVVVTIDPDLDNVTYTWTPTEGLSCSDCPNPTASPSETTTYEVIVEADNGCNDTTQVTIVVTTPCGDIFMPTIFSPNADGLNDELCLLGNCITELDLKIYDRWGELVFETTDPSFCWDGSFRGKPMNSAVFVYKLLVRTTDGQEVEESGNVNLVR